MVEASLKRKLGNFPNIGYRDKKRLYDLSDILSEIQSAKRNPNYEKLLSYFDTSAGVNPVVLKLPQHAQGKWRDKATHYKKSHCVSYPPFEFFVNFVHDLATTMNDPGFIYETESSTVQRFDRPISKMRVSTAKTAVADERDTYMPRCVIHKANHSLNECRAFREKSFEDRRKLVREHGLCFKCLNSSDHISRDCKENVPCKECGSYRHATGMHSAPNANPTAADVSQSHGGERQAPHALRSYGGERSVNITSQQHQSQRKFVPQSTNPDRHMMSSSMQASREPYNVNSKCTEICKGEFGGKSCAKIVPVNISHSDYPHQHVIIYAIIDEQSNKSLAKKELFDMFSINSEPERYTLSSCAGRTTLSGRRSQGFVVESLDSTSQMNLPTVIECEEIPNNRDEIPTPEIAMHHPHLQSIANKLSPLDAQTDILLLIGRDLMEAHHILEQKLGPLNTPYAQRLRLGWVIVGETCLGGSHVPNAVTTLRTYVTTDGRHSIFKPCDSEIHVREVNTQIPNINLATDDFFGSSIFARTQNDDRPGMSVEDKSFLKLMADHCYKGEDGSWVAPLPFRASRPRLPNNKLSALHRAKNLDSSLKKDPIKREHILVFMQDLLDSGYAELAPRLDPGEECWYLPLFGVYHPKKKDQIRCVFDSSAKFSGISLNDVLLTGPDLINNLVGVLMRFRKERIAVTADIKKMFYCFMVSPEDRNYLRFLWHRDNKLDNDLVDYRMRVHVFGNSPSPAVASYCLRKTAEEAEHIYGSDVKEFVERNFYVDDALSSHHTSSEAVDLLKRTQAALKEHGNIRLHKLSSNSEEVLSAFPPEDLAKGLRDLDFQFEALPLQTSLGLTWDIQEDVFKFLTTADNKPFTRRGVLSVVSSIFDPLGLVAPITIQGKLLLRKFMTNGLDWDDTFQAEDYEEWRKWKESLLSLTDVRIPGPYVKASPSQASSCELHVFSDASEKSIAAVSYLRVVDKDGLSHLGFLYGKTKVALAHGHTIPRLELCAAVMSVQMTDVILEQLDLIIDFVKFYTDSRVVLGYIQNERRRFHVYVGNRVDVIRKSSIPSQWNYVPTHLNPADVGTRSISTSELQASVWLQGPASFLGRGTESEEQETHNLVGPDEDKEVRPANFAMTLKTSVESSDSITIGTERYKRFSTWKSRESISLVATESCPRRIEKY